MALLRVPGRVAAVAAQLALVVALAALVGFGLLPRTGWYRPVTVLSGSMQPAFAPGVSHHEPGAFTEQPSSSGSIFRARVRSAIRRSRVGMLKSAIS